MSEQPKIEYGRKYTLKDGKTVQVWETNPTLWGVAKVEGFVVIEFVDKPAPAVTAPKSLSEQMFGTKSRIDDFPIPNECETVSEAWFLENATIVEKQMGAWKLAPAIEVGGSFPIGTVTGQPFFMNTTKVQSHARYPSTTLTIN